MEELGVSLSILRITSSSIVNIVVVIVVACGLGGTGDIGGDSSGCCGDVKWGGGGVTGCSVVVDKLVFLLHWLFEMSLVIDWLFYIYVKVCICNCIYITFPDTTLGIFSFTQSLKLQRIKLCS